MTDSIPSPVAGGGDRRLRILLVGPAPPFRGGIAHHTAELHRTLGPLARVTLHSYHRQYPKFLYPGRSDVDPAARPIDGVHYDLDCLNPWTWLKVGRLARDSDALCLPWWTQFWAPHYLLLALCLWGSGTRLIIICHNVVDHDAGPVARFLARRVLRRSHRFIVQTTGEQAGLKTILRRDAAVRIIPHPRVDRFAGGPSKSRETARKELDLPVDGTVILFFGLIRPYKGLDLLLKAFSHLAGEDPTVRLLVAGEPWVKDVDFEGDARRLGVGDRIRFRLEYLSDEDLTTCLRASDFAVFPYIEGTGSAALQAALGAGLPVVASRLPTFQEVEDHGYGLLVPPNDPGALVDALRRFVEADGRQPFAERISRDRGDTTGWNRLADAVVELASGTSDLGHAILETNSRRAKARKIARLIGRVRAIEGTRILEIGTGSGIIAHVLSRINRTGSVCAVDVRDERVTADGYDFQLVGSTHLPFGGGTFDIVVSNHVIEHVGEREAQLSHLTELGRLLAPSGLGYLAFPNRWRLFEAHFRLPFLSWLPGTWADAAVRFFGRGERYDCHPLSRTEILALIAEAGLEAEEITRQAIRATLEVEYPGLVRRLLLGLTPGLFTLFRGIVPTLVFILRRKPKP